MSIDPAELQKLLEERDKSRRSRRRSWENLQELRWVLNDTCGIELPPPPRKPSTSKKAGSLRTASRRRYGDRQEALSELVDAVRLYRKLADSKPLTLREADYAKAVERLNAAIDRPDGLVSQ